MHKWELAATSICECCALDQSAVHVILKCPLSLKCLIIITPIFDDLLFKTVVQKSLACRSVAVQVLPSKHAT